MRYTTGCVTKSGRFWRLCIDAVDEDGTRRRLTRTTKVPCKKDTSAGRRDALTALRRWREELEAEEEARQEAAQATVARGETVAEYAAGYLAATKGRISAETYRGYRASVNALARFPIGAIKLGDLTANDVSNYDDDLRAAGLGPVTVQKRHAYLAQITRHAVEIGDLDVDPCASVKAPRAPRKPVNSLTKAAAREVMSQLVAMGEGNAVAAAARLALMTGLRRGELCALRWHDWDEDAGLLRVNHALGASYEGGRRLKGAKDPTGTGAERVVPVSAPLARLLGALRDRQGAQCARLGCAWRPALYILGNVLGEPMNPDTLSRKWAAVAQAYGWTGTTGEPLRFHDLRHTFATLAIAEGADVMSLAAVLGHRNPAMTMQVYAVALAGPKKMLMDGVGDFYDASEKGAGNE